ERKGGEAEGDVDEEDPLPAGAVDEWAADQPGRGGADGAEPAPDPKRLVPLGALLERGCDDRERSRGHDRGAGALDDTGGKERGGREEEDTGHEQAAAPEQVGRPSTEQEQAAEGERVGAQHPLQVLFREAEVGSDRRQRDEHDRAVEEHHEEGAAEERERPPAAGIGCSEHAASIAWWRGAAFHEFSRLSFWIRGMCGQGDVRPCAIASAKWPPRAVAEVYDRGVAVRQGGGALDHRRAPRG